MINGKKKELLLTQAQTYIAMGGNLIDKDWDLGMRYIKKGLQLLAKYEKYVDIDTTEVLEFINDEKQKDAA